jgi:hypothetical protein
MVADTKKGEKRKIESPNPPTKANPAGGPPDKFGKLPSVGKLTVK